MEKVITIKDYTGVHKELILRVINRDYFEAQGADFSKIVHKDILDLTAVAYIGEVSENETHLNPVTLRMCEDWGKTPEEVYEEAFYNSALVNPINFNRVADFIYETGVKEAEKRGDIEMAAHFEDLANEFEETGNEEKIIISAIPGLGTSYFLANPEMQKALSETLGGKSYYISPLSTDELIVSPRELTEEEKIIEILSIAGTNVTSLKVLKRPEVILSGNLYFYNAVEHKLEIAMEV